MAYPYGSLATGKADGTNLQTDHPAHHNAMAAALNDLLAELGAGPRGGSADLTARLLSIEAAANPVVIAKGGTGQVTAPEGLFAIGGQTADGATAAGLPFAGRSSTVQRFHRAYANRATDPLKILFLGDSEFEQSWVHRATVNVLSKMLNPANRQVTIGGNSAGSLYPGETAYGFGNAVAPTIWSSVGSPSIVQVTPVQNHRGFAGNALKMTDGQACQANATTCDQVTFYWLTPLAGAGATLEFFIDGVSVHTSTSTAAGNYTWNSAVTPASHVIKITSHGENLFDFVQIFNGNHDANLQPWSSVHSGYSTGDFNLCTDLAGYLAAIDPDLIVIQPMINDADGSAWYTAMTTLVTTVKANTTAALLLCQPPFVNNGNSKAVWDVKRQRFYRLAQEQNTMTCDATLWFPDLSAADPLGYTIDGVHVASTGANGRAVWANAIVASLFGSNVSEYPLWEASTLYSGSPGLIRAFDNNQGGMSLGWFLKRADTQPTVAVASQPGFALNGIFFGPGGTTNPDTTLLRSDTGVLGLSNVLTVASSAITGVRLATTGALPTVTASGSGAGKTLTAIANGALANIDNRTPAVNERILVNNQATKADNGVYVVTQVGTGGTPFILTRSPGLDASGIYRTGVAVDVQEGEVWAGSRLHSHPRGTSFTLDTTALTFLGPKRMNGTPADIAFGSDRTRARYACDFEENDATITTTATRWAGTSFAVNLSGAAAQATQAETTDLIPGVIQLETGTATGGYVSVIMSNRGIAFATTSRERFYGRVKVPTVQDGTDDFVCWVGLMDNFASATDPTSGVFFRSRRSGGVNLNWECVTRNAGTETAVDSGTALNTVAYQQLAMFYDEIAATAYFFIGTTEVSGGGILTNLPSGVTLNGAAKIHKAAGTTSRTFRVDYLEFDRPNARTFSVQIP